MQFCGINQFPINFTPEGLTKRTRSARYFNSITLILFCLLTFGACHKKGANTHWMGRESTFSSPESVVAAAVVAFAVANPAVDYFCRPEMRGRQKKKWKMRKNPYIKLTYVLPLLMLFVCLFVRLSSQVSINRNSLCLCLKDLVGPGEKEKTN